LKQITFAHDRKASTLIIMSILRKILIPALLFNFAAVLSAVTVNSKAIKNKAIYGIEFPGDARSYYGREDAVQSISKQEYITATFKVVEINIVTSGSALVRIYHGRPLKASEAAEALGNGTAVAGFPSVIRPTPIPQSILNMADRAHGVADTITSSTVIKDYPIATHARTIEFRLQSRDELLELFDELEKHWLKKPALHEDGQVQIEDQDSKESTEKTMKPRSLGGTTFTVRK
jgi:hypothetical protein